MSISPTWERDGVRIYLGDCMEILSHLPKVDAVVTDPPYGINADVAAKKAAESRIKADGKSKAGRGWKDYGWSNWDDVRPDAGLFRLACDVSEKQVFWGGNYFADMLPPSSKWLIWDKGQTDFSLADVEVAWCSWSGAMRRILYPRACALKDGKVHPTQKPIAVMVWCIEQVPNEPETILDPFMGSGTTGVACVKLGRKFIGIEKEPKYFEIAVKRIERALSEERSSLFPVAKEVQTNLFSEEAL